MTALGGCSAPEATILLVDDEPRVLHGLSRLLADRFRLIEASNGAQALELLQSEPIAVVVSDLVMPAIDGLTLLERASQIAPTTVRILLTGHGDYDIAVRAVNDARAFGFLTKPCSPAKLEELLEQAIQEHLKLVAGSDALERVSRLQQSLRDIARSVEQVGIEVATDDPVAALPELGSLSQREWEVVRMLLQGHRVPRIAKNLSISSHTVRSHLRRIFQKLSVNSQAELVARLRGVL